MFSGKQQRQSSKILRLRPRLQRATDGLKLGRNFTPWRCYLT